MNKNCRKCKILRPLSDFHDHPAMKSGKVNTCKECYNAYKVERYYKNKDSKEYKDSAKDRHLRRNYNISLKTYQLMFEEQDGKCLICKYHRNDLPRDLSVDHCHKTKKVRGLLCDKCNQGIGSFDENYEFLKNAMEYLYSHSTLPF
jgi:hypothetical protein